MSLCKFVNLFHVGLFFIVSGICFTDGYSNDINGFLKLLWKRIKQLYVPFVLWNIGYLCLHNLLCDIHIYNTDTSAPAVYLLTKYYDCNTWLNMAGRILLMQAGEPLAGASWFIRALFVMEILFGFIDWTIKKIKCIPINISRVVIAVLFTLLRI